jgi:hypothetical protein
MSARRKGGVVARPAAEDGWREAAAEYQVVEAAFEQFDDLAAGGAFLLLGVEHDAAQLALGNAIPPGNELAG